MPRMFHVSSTLNRESIQTHGLDWSRMGAAPGIAGSVRPEQHGVFLCSDEYESNYFVELNNTGGPVDVWGVDGVDEVELVPSGTGYRYLPRRIAPENLTLISASLQGSGREVVTVEGPTGAYQSTITVTLDDGTVLHDDEARQFILRVQRDAE